MDALGALAESSDEASRALQLVKKIVGNLVAHPAEEKFRSINLHGKAGQKLVAVPECLALLESLGFHKTEDGQSLVIPEAQAASPEMVTALGTLPAPQDQRAAAAPTPAPHAAASSMPTTGMSAKRKAKMLIEEKERAEKERAKELRKEELERIRQDAYVRKNDPNWKSGVSAAAGKGGEAISTFREKFGEDKGG